MCVSLGHLYLIGGFKEFCICITVSVQDGHCSQLSRASEEEGAEGVGRKEEGGDTNR